MKYLKNIVFISLPVFIAFFLVTELFLRNYRIHLNIDELTGKTYTKDPKASWSYPDAYSDFRGKPGLYSTDKTINSHSFISTPELTVHKDSSIVRIAFFGGSSTAGTGVNLEDEFTWPWIVGEKLRSITSKKVEILNAALGAYTTFESFGAFWSRVRYYKPDIVIVNHAWNDMYYFRQNNEHMALNWKKKDSWEYKKVSLKRYDSHWIDKYISWSQVLVRFRFIIINNLVQSGGELFVEKKEKSKNILKSNPVSNNKEILDTYRFNLQLFENVSDMIGAKLYVCKQATLLNKSEKSVHYGYDQQNRLGWYSDVYSILENDFQENQLIDFSVLNGEKEYFADHVHPTPLGSKKFSEIVFAQLKTDSLFMN